MLIADGGAGYSGTNWMSTDVRFMWSTIANQETDPHFDVVEGWRKTADLTLAHLGQVQMYRDNLASVWPPTKSAAAAAYLARLDKLLVDLRATHQAASANYTAFSTVTLTLSLARNKLKPILEQYEANEQLNLDWQAKQEAAQAQATPPQLTPVLRIPPVSSARQEELNNQARAIMYDLSSTVLSGQAALKKPNLYLPDGDGRTGGDPDRSNTDSNSGFAVPPVIPPPGGSGSGGSISTYLPVSHANMVPIPSTTNAPLPSGSGVAGPGAGPILGGIGTTPVTTPPALGLPPVPGPSPIPPSPPPGLVPGLITPPGSGPLTAPSGFLPNGAKVPPGGLAKPGVGTGPGGRMTIPSGGVIGSTPGSGMIGQMPAGNPGGRPGGALRANPIGSIIGQQGGGSPGRGAVNTGRGVVNQSMPLGNQAGRGRSHRDGDSELVRWDPDNPWVTAEGVDPVVRPPAEGGPIDPGPAIGFPR
jgi:hypothetical protein